jgi:transcriptional regulator with XRE-family HTH domain
MLPTQRGETMTTTRGKKQKTGNQRSNTITDKEIGLRIRAIRVDQDMSQDQLGKLLQVSFQQVQKYEKGSNRVSAARLIKIAKALHTTPHHLLDWENIAKLDRLNGSVEFDMESYKLARVFVQLPDRTKPAIRSLINSLISTE